VPVILEGVNMPSAAGHHIMRSVKGICTSCKIYHMLMMSWCG
jgi:hypothetical protein